MTDRFILSEKVRQPAATGLIRARLIDPLSSPVTTSLALVLGPAGSGKTTLLAQAAAASADPVGWYRVAADDSTEAAFVSHLARAYFDAVEQLRELPSEIGELLEVMDAEGGRPCVLVLDDIHEISGSDAESVLEAFLSLRPQTVRVLLGSRRPPEVNLPRLRVSGAIREISSDDLRFRSWEVEELFADIHREPLSPETAAALTRRTGGWAAGLQLFHIATTGKSVAARARAVTELGPQSRLIRSYLARNVLTELPPARREFMLRTCTLGLMSGPLCDALLATTGSGAVLEDLERQQLFTSSWDDGITFRYHEVLQRHLELTLVAEYGEQTARDWYSRSAAVQEQLGVTREAIAAHARAEDWSSVARLVRHDDTGDAVTADPAGWLPRRVWERDPWLALAEARRRVRRGDLRGAGRAFRNAEALLDDPDFRYRCQREGAAVRTWLPDGLSALTELEPAARRPWTDQLRSAMVRLPAARSPSDDHRGVGSEAGTNELVQGLTALLAGDFALATDRMHAVGATAGRGGLASTAAQLALVVIDLATGQNRDRVGQLEEIILAADFDGLAWLSRLTRGIMTAVLNARGGPDWRWAAGDDLLRECEQDGDDWGAALIEFAAGIAADVVRAPDAYERYQNAGQRFARLNAPVLQTWADALGERRKMAGTASEWLDSIRLVESRARQLRIPALLLLLEKARAGGPPEAWFDSPGYRSVSRHETDVLRGQPHPGSDPAGMSRSEARLVCFGGFRLIIDGEERTMNGVRPRARRLLHLLALEPGRDRHREWLIDTLWPNVDLPTGTRRLQVAVSSIRHEFHRLPLTRPPDVHRRGDSYGLELPPGMEVDVELFERLVRTAGAARSRGDVDASAAARQHALDLYVGDLLPEDGPAEHVVTERDRLRLLAAVNAADLARDYAQLGRATAAVTAVQRSIVLDPFSDLAWSLLADLHTAAGDLSAAARVRLEHERVRHELAESIG